MNDFCCKESTNCGKADLQLGLGHGDFYPVGTIKGWVTSANHMPVCASVSLKVIAHNSITQFYNPCVTVHTESRRKKVGRKGNTEGHREKNLKNAYGNL